MRRTLKTWSICALLVSPWTSPSDAFAEAGKEQPSSGRGIVVVTANVTNAELRVDGHPKGGVPATLTLAAGDHYIHVRKLGYEDYVRLVHVGPGDTLTTAAALDVLPPAPQESAWLDLRPLQPLVPYVGWTLLGVLCVVCGVFVGRYVVHLFTRPRLTIQEAVTFQQDKRLGREWSFWAREIAIRHQLLSRVMEEMESHHRRQSDLPIGSDAIGNDAPHLSEKTPLTPVEAVNIVQRIREQRTRATNASDDRWNQRVLDRYNRRRVERNRKLAATDLFVEKAQGLLSFRSLLLTITGSTCTIFGVAILLAGALVLDAMHPPPADLQVPAMLVRVFRGMAIGGFFLGAAGFLLYLAKAMFHEAMQLVSRRHSLRFGRLYVHLTGGQFADFEHLERAFQWTREFSTGFKEIRHELPRGVLGEMSKFVQSATEATKAAGEAATKMAKR